MAVGDGVSAIASLTATFGGFSPTAMDGVQTARDTIERTEAELARRREAANRKREIERARASEPRRFEDRGTIWVYVIIDKTMARLVGCETSAKSIIVPEEIDGIPVVAIAADACARLDSVEEIVCGSSIEVIGSCAFRLCPQLKVIEFPDHLVEFDSSWIQHCPCLESLVLPGYLDVIPTCIFDNRGLRRLVIGSKARLVEPGAFQNTRLEELVISEENPYIKTDGTAIYSFDGATLMALGRPVESYEVLKGCRRLAKKACYNIESLVDIKLPEGIEELGEFALSHTGIVSCALPNSVRSIGAKSFYYCKNLKSITLNEGLEVIGPSAFEESALEKLRIPASIREIGNSMTARSNIVHSGPDCSITIDEASESLFLDGQGGLYRRENDGVHFIQLIDQAATRFTVAEGTSFINDYAFAYHESIQAVSISEGVTNIGASAFRYCGSLTSVILPSTLERVGDAAFIDTMLEKLIIPARVEYIGKDALVTKGAHRGEEAPSLRKIEVEEGNPKYFMTQGMLCRREDDGVHVVIFTSSEPNVAFPDDVVGIDQYAFNNARDIECLSLNKGLRTISTAGLTTWCWIRKIHIELDEPIEGRTEFDFEFPDTQKSKHGISQGIGGATWVNVPGIMAQYDNCVATARDYNYPRNPDNISAYDQVRKVLDRLKDPILLTDFNRGVYERLLRNYITEICIDVARHDDRSVINSLVDLGFINTGNLEDVIMAVGKLQDAAMTGYLLELKRVRFGKAAFDFDL